MLFHMNSVALMCHRLRLTVSLILFAVCCIALIMVMSDKTTESNEFGKYWFIEHIHEQLGKARYHFLEQLTICNLLNRTLLLPNVGNSEFGLRRNLPFHTYYQRAELEHYVRTISTEEFLSHIINLKLKRPITISVVYIHLSKCPSEQLSWKQFPNDILKRLSSRFTIKTATTLCFLTNHGLKPPVLPDMILKNLNTSHSMTDIFLVIKRSALFLMDPNKLPVHILKHNETLIQTAKTFSNSISPYLAIHWRMEGATGNGEICVQRLLRTVTNVTRIHYFEKIYFATDHANSNERLLSNSFLKTRADQTNAYYEIMNTLKPLTYRNISSYSVNIDSGVLSIIEKLICEESDFFLAGYIPCDRVGSYGREIVKYRQFILKKPWLYWNEPTQLYEPRNFYPL